MEKSLVQTQEYAAFDDSRYRENPIVLKISCYLLACLFVTGILNLNIVSIILAAVFTFIAFFAKSPKNTRAASCALKAIFYLSFPTMLILIGENIENARHRGAFSSLLSSLALFISIPAAVFIYRKMNNIISQRSDNLRQSVDSQNAQIQAQNQQIMQQNEMIQNRRREMYNSYLAMKDELLRNTQSWYPPNYYSQDAVTFFITAIQNFRADNLKEAINLYETTEQHKKLLEYQAKQDEKLQDMLRSNQRQEAQLAFNNVLSGINLFQTQQMNEHLSNISQDTNVISQAASDLHKKVMGYRIDSTRGNGNDGSFLDRFL